MANKSTVSATTRMDFETYVQKHCQDVTKEQAKQYAQEGMELLRKINNGEKVEKDDLRQNMARIVWCLTEQSFKNGEPFGKGMFTLSMKNIETLYQLLKNGCENIFSASAVHSSAARSLQSVFQTYSSYAAPDNDDKNPTYSRTSSHFNKQIIHPEDGHFGIDMQSTDNTDIIPLPSNFKTAAFALCQDEKGNKFLYVKPETESADIRRDASGSMKHGAKFLASKLKGPEESKKGLLRYDEKNGEHLQFTLTDAGQMDLKKQQRAHDAKPPAAAKPPAVAFAFAQATNRNKTSKKKASADKELHDENVVSPTTKPPSL